MSQSSHFIYLSNEDPKIYVYTGDRRDGTKFVLRELGFEYQFCVYSYGWSVEDGLMFSLIKYLDMNTSDLMLRLARISNGNDAKIRRMNEEVNIAQVKLRKRWWQYYVPKKL
jgi:hypothetical protein